MTFPRLLRLINLLLVGLLVWLLGTIISRLIEYRYLKVPFQAAIFVASASRMDDRPIDISEFQPIIDFNVFNAEVGRQETTVVNEEATPVPGENLKLIIDNLQLIGISLRSGKSRYCILRDRAKNKEDLFSLGDTVFDTNAIVSRIVAISGRQQVTIKLGNESAVLEYQQDEPAKTASPSQAPKPMAKAEPVRTAESRYSSDGTNFYITSEEVDTHLNNFAQLLNQARMVPFFKKGQHQGYQVKAIDKGSLYEKLGLQNNDIIEEINGEPLDSMEKVMGLFKKLRNERAFTVKINRKGASQFQNYHIN